MSARGSTPLPSAKMLELFTMPSDLEYSWTAGLIDGDGCISLQPSGPSRFRSPVVVVDSTDLEIIEELKRLHGGSVVRKKKYKDHHRQAWSWRMYGATNILAFLRGVLPYMRCTFKRERALMLVEGWSAVTPRNGYYTEELRAAKLVFETQFMGSLARGSRRRE